MIINEIVDVLHANRLMRTQDEIDAFDEALADLSKQPAAETQQYLARLYLVFDDECEQIEVMWSLLHLMEDFDFEPWFRALASVLPAVRQQAPDWTELFVIRTLNSEQARPELRRLLPTLPADQQQQVRALLEVVRGTNPEKGTRIDEVLQ